MRAAVELADADGLAAVSMSRVAERLGFATMSLYRHVQNKDELLTLMVNEALRPPVSIDEPATDWRAGLERWCREMHAGLRRHPWIERVPVGGMIGTPSQAIWLDRGLRTLEGTGLSEQEKADALLLLNGYVFWEARLSEDLEQASTAGEDAPAFGALLSFLADPERFPALRRAIDAGIFDADDQDDRDADFDWGLARVLDGLEPLVTRAGR